MSDAPRTSVPTVRSNDPSHPAPIPQQRPVRQIKQHRPHRHTRAPFLPHGHVPAKHGLKPVE